ncbi:MAG: alpha/beta hydrolase [Rhizobiaceae bacterium]|nr:alpha/beta hydrolase [Rhizobiaceae bacterium]
MNFLWTILAVLAGILLVLFVGTRVGVILIERRNPPAGEFADVLGARIHHVHVPAPAGAELPPVVFIHGASGNLNDQMLPARPLLEGRAELLFYDRPGHGWSQRGEANETPNGQARTLAALMDAKGIDRAIIVGHSFGGGIAAAFALAYPERVAGLVFAAAATHPWEGAGTSWYYKVATVPLFGRVFSELFALPGGYARINAAAAGVFDPNPLPATYLRDSGIELVLRPANFRANAVDVESLHAHVTTAAPHYPEIKAPTVVISGDSDTVVYEELHSLGLARDIKGAELVWICGLGHKPDWVAPDLVAAAIEKVAGRPVDLQTLCRAVEARIVAEIGPRRCRSPEEAALTVR